MRITFVTRKFGNVERNSHCDVLHITPIRVARLFLDCNGDFAIKAYKLRNKSWFDYQCGEDNVCVIGIPPLYGFDLLAYKNICNLCIVNLL